jgi:hypothetical protein
MNSAPTESSAALAIRARLLATPAVVALLGSRIHPQRAPQNGGDLPYLVYRVESADDDPRISGGLSEVSVRLIAVARSTPALSGYDAVRAIAGALKTALDQRTWTDGATYVRGCFLGDATDLSIEPDDGSDEPLDGVEHTYRVFLRE